MSKKNYPFGEKNIRDLYLLGANDEYKAEMERILKKYNPPSDRKIIDGKKELDFIQSPKSREMAREYLEIISKYNLAWLCDFLISYIIKEGYLVKVVKGENIKFDAKKMTRHLLSSSGIKMIDKDKEYVTLTIHKDTSIKDIQKFWPEIKKISTSRKKKGYNLIRDLEIYRLKNNGLKAKEITNKINSNPRFKEQKIQYQEVSKIIKRLKTRAQKNIPHKDS